MDSNFRQEICWYANHLLYLPDLCTPKLHYILEVKTKDRGTAVQYVLIMDSTKPKHLKNFINVVTLFKACVLHVSAPLNTLSKQIIIF